MWSPESRLSLDPVRGYAERKNLFPIAANFEMDTRTPVGATLCGRPAQLLGFPVKNLRFGRRRLLFPTKRTRAPTKAMLLWEKGRTAEEAMLFRQEKRAK